MIGGACDATADPAKADAGTPRAGSGGHDPGDDPQIACTGILSWGVRLEVEAEQGGSCDGIEVTVTDGAYSERLMPIGCSFVGAGERAGTYAARLEGHGRALSISHIVVRPEVCHVITAVRHVRFTRACTDALQEGADAGIDTADRSAPPSDCVTEP